MENLFIYVIGPAVTILLTWLTAMRKYRAETKTDELANVTEAIKIWRELAESFESKLAEKESAFKELKSQLEFITKQNGEMIEKMTALEKDYNKLQKNYNDLKNSLK